MADLIKVDYYKDDVLKDTNNLARPKKYEDFIKDIIKKFNLEGKNLEIILKVITYDEDDYTTKSQENLQYYMNNYNIREFKFNVKEKEDSNFTIHNKDNQDEKNEDDKIDKKDVVKHNFLEKVDISIDLDIDNIMKDILNNEGYKKKMKNEEIKYTDIFKNNLEKSFNTVLEQKGNDIKEKIKNEISNYSNISLESHKEVFKTIIEMNNTLKKDKDFIKEMSQLNLDNSNKIIQKKEDDKIKDNNIIEIKEKIQKKPDDIFPINIKFEKKRIEKILDIKDAKFINIDNIRITNVGHEVYKSLNFVRDKNNSSNDIYFFSNSANSEEQELTMPGEFEHDDSHKFNTNLMIKYPKPNQTYKMIIYVREKNDDENLSEPLEIIIKTNQIEDPIQQRQKQANQIYEKIKNEFLDYEYLIDKDEIIIQLLDNNLNEGEIKKNIISKINEIKEKQRNEEIEKIFKELEFYNMDFNKEEIINLIKEKNLEKEKVQNWIKEQKSELIYDELNKSDDVDISKVSKEEVLKNIIKLNFKIDEIKKLYPIFYSEYDEEKIKEIIDYLEEIYGVLGKIGEDKLRKKIIELKMDMNLINSWVQDNII